jgi:hypothetical protein
MQFKALRLYLVLGITWGSIQLGPAAGAEKVDPGRIRDLVEQLGNGNFAEREKATELLDTIGGPALEPLRKAVKEGDAEVQRRGQELIKKIEKRVEAESILKPHMVTFRFKDTPINEAVDTINKKTGFSIQLHDPQKKLVDRRITLEIPETTFWQAFDQFCEKAGLVEATAQDLANQNLGAAKGGSRPDNRLPAPGAPPAMGRAYRIDGMAPTSPSALILVDGKRKKEPTLYAGAIRIRHLPPGTQMPGTPRQEGELEIPLQVNPEPKVAWHGIARVRIDKALDDSNQELAQETNQNDPNGENVVFMANGGRAIMVRGGISYARGYPGNVQGGPNQVGVRLKKGDNNSKSLKELKGVVAVLAQTEPQTMLTIDSVIKTKADDTFEFGEGGTIKVLKATKNDEGQIDLQVELLVPPGVIPAGIPLANTRVSRVRGGGKIAFPDDPSKTSGATATPAGAYGGFNLLDADGKPIPYVGASSNLEMLPDRTYKQICTLTFKASKDQADSAKLVFNGSRQVTVEVPFDLKDIPLQ